MRQLSAMNTLHFENNAPLESCNTFGIAARARQLLRVQHPAQRQAAILFADIAGSTRPYETLGDAEALATITRALDLIRQVCEEHGGRIVKTIGDEAMAIFPNAANAAYAAITMQTQVSGM